MQGSLLFLFLVRFRCSYERFGALLGLFFLFSGGLDSVWAFLGASFPPLGGLPGSLGGLLGPLLRLLNAILSF